MGVVEGGGFDMALTLFGSCSETLTQRAILIWDREAVFHDRNVFAGTDTPRKKLAVRE
jgi:hypothetical protein